MGKVGKLGWTILFESIRNIKKVYPEFDIFVCHNKLSDEEIDRLGECNVNLIRQDDLDKPFDFFDHDEGLVRNFCWKLIPPRIRIDAHELWVDNDIIIRDRIARIDQWLMTDAAIIGTGYNPDYGQFINVVKSNYVHCAGFFGLPPDFDFQEALSVVCDGRKLTGYDEQGVVTHIVTRTKNYISLPQSDLALLSEYWSHRGVRWFPNGLHFARANRFDGHKSWKSYKLAITP